MSEKIVYLDVANADMRKILYENLPEGFELVCADARTEDECAAAVGDAQYIFHWSIYVTRKVIQAAPLLKMIQTGGEGVDHIDLVAARERGIVVGRTPGNNSNAVAELTTLLMLSVYRSLPRAHIGMLEGKWLKWELRFDSFELRGKQVGIIGLGKIGKIVAQHVQGFGATPVYYDVYRLPEEVERQLGVRYLPLDQLMSSSDVITLHVPLAPSTQGMIGRKELLLMKPTAIIVNTCRGNVIDSDALYQVLTEKRIRGAGLDAHFKEPAGPDYPFIGLDNVVLTPHYGGGTLDAMVIGVRHAYANMVKVSRGEPLSPIDYAPDLK